MRGATWQPPPVKGAMTLEFHASGASRREQVGELPFRVTERACLESIGLRRPAGSTPGGRGAAYSSLAHSTCTPRLRRFSTKRGWARRIGVALRISERPSMLLAIMKSAIATRMM